MSNLGSNRVEVPPKIFVHELHHPSVTTFAQMNFDSVSSETSRDVMMLEVDWRIPFIDYIKEQVLPSGVNKEDAEAI